MYEKIMHNYEPSAENLLYILHDIQDYEPQQYLSEQAIREVSEYLQIPSSQIYSVATFYSLYSIEPRGKYVIRVCESPPCHLMGAISLIDELCSLLEIEVGETTSDGLFTLETTSCLGVCGVAPAIMINKDLYGNLTPKKLHGIIKNYKKQETVKA